MFKLFALVLLALWLTATVVFVPLLISGGVLLSIDEEWNGWVSWLLNPYIMVPYVALSATTALCLVKSRVITDAGSDDHTNTESVPGDPPIKQPDTGQPDITN